MFMTIFLIFFYLTLPVLIIYLTQVSKTINKIGAVVLAYILGLLIGNVGIFPRPSKAMQGLLAGKASLTQNELLSNFNSGILTESDLIANQIMSIQDIILTIVIPLAIPLLLFSLDIKRWLKLAKGALLSLLLAIVSLLIVIFAGYFLFKDEIAESWKVTGMLVGIYSGGTPNLAAIATALDVNPNTFILTHTYDMVLGAVMLLFLLTSAQRLLNTFLPHFQESHAYISKKEMFAESKDMDNFKGMLTRKGIVSNLKALGLSVSIFAFAGGISLLVPSSAQMVTVILCITTVGLFFSTIKFIHRIEKSFQLGMYLIIVFSLVVASMGDLKNMFQIDFLHLFLFVALTVFGSMIIHIVLSKIFKVDSDTTIITITALTYSPPFVPVVAGALKNKEVIISGLTVGILGYAFGNYIGVAIAYFLKGF